jgi:hypothetical protein
MMELALVSSVPSRSYSTLQSFVSVALPSIIHVSSPLLIRVGVTVSNKPPLHRPNTSCWKSSTYTILPEDLF